MLFVRCPFHTAHLTGHEEPDLVELHHEAALWSVVFQALKIGESEETGGSVGTPHKRGQKLKRSILKTPAKYPAKYPAIHLYWIDSPVLLKACSETFDLPGKRLEFRVRKINLT